MLLSPFISDKTSVWGGCILQLQLHGALCLLCGLASMRKIKVGPITHHPAESFRRAMISLPFFPPGGYSNL